MEGSKCELALQNPLNLLTTYASLETPEDPAFSG